MTPHIFPTDTDFVKTIANFMLLSGDLEKWNVVKAKNPQYHNKTGRNESKMIKWNKSMIDNPNWSIIED